MKSKKGISLIVLVITIIVMIILAAAIILSLNNAGIIGNANKAVEETDEAQLKNIAALAWSDAYLARSEDSTIDLKTETIANIREAGITTDKLPDEDIFVTEKGVLLVGIDKMDHNTGIIVPGAKYIKADGTELTAGQSMPTPQPMDRYVYDGYTYVYGAKNYYWGSGYSKETFTEQFREDTTNRGWLVTVWENTEQEQYSQILSYINNIPITSMEGTFAGCKKLKTMPYIPNTVTNMTGTFDTCEGLTTFPEGFTIPKGVTKMDYTFFNFNNLAGTIIINANPSSYTACFGGAYGVNNITIIGETTMKEELLATENEL